MAVTISGSGQIVKQVVQVVKTDTFSTANTSFTQVTGLSASITPTSASNKILVLFNGMGSVNNGANFSLQLQRGSTPIFIGDAASTRSQCSFGGNGYNGAGGFPFNIAYLDSPATTSPITYNIAIRTDGSSTIYVNRTVTDEDSANRGRTASSIIVMEVAYS